MLVDHLNTLSSEEQRVLLTQARQQMYSASPSAVQELMEADKAYDKIGWQIF